MPFDVRPLERVLSIFLWAVLAFMGGTFAFMGFFAGLAVLFDYPVIGLGTWCVSLPPIPIGIILLAWLFKWTRGGSIRRYTAELGSALGVQGTLDGPSMLFFALTPEWTAEVDGRAVRLQLRRTAGFLSPLSPGGSLGLPWTLQGFVDGEGGSGKVGFTHPKAVTFGVGLLGLSNPVKKEGVQLLVGERPELADDEAVLEKARAVPYGPTTLLAIGRDGLTWTDRLSGVPAEELAERLRAVLGVMGAMEANEGAPSS